MAVSQNPLSTVALVYSRIKCDPAYLTGCLIIGVRLLWGIWNDCFCSWPCISPAGDGDNSTKFSQTLLEILEKIGFRLMKYIEVFGILIKCCEVETNFLLETEQYSTPRCRDITFCTERESCKEIRNEEFWNQFANQKNYSANLHFLSCRM